MPYMVVKQEHSTYMLMVTGVIQAPCLTAPVQLLQWELLRFGLLQLVGNSLDRDIFDRPVLPGLVAGEDQPHPRVAHTAGVVCARLLQRLPLLARTLKGSTPARNNA